MFQRNISVAQLSRRSSASEQANDTDFQSAASSPTNFSHPSTAASNFSSAVKIIDIQKTRYSRREQQAQLDRMLAGEEDHNRTGANTAETVSGAGPNRSNTTQVGQSTSPSTNRPDPQPATTSQQAANSNRWSPNVSATAKAPSQKQPSGETLSSFESDYDLLVYLGETETEDIVDTERSLDYQDQTWRQSICGASLAPTIDESLSELTSHQPGSGGGGQVQDFDLLNTPTPLGLGSSSSPFATPSSSLRLSSNHLADNNLLAGPTSNQRQVSAPGRGATTGPKQHQHQQSNQRHQQIRPQTPGNRRPWDLDFNDECDSEVSSVFSDNNNITKNRLAADQLPGISSAGGTNPSGSTNQAKLSKESEYANLDNWQQINNNTKLYKSNYSAAAADRTGRGWMPNYISNSGQNRVKANTMGRNQEPTQQLTGGDELDRLLAEMSQSLDLDALARYDPQPSARPVRPNRPTESSQTLGSRCRYEQPDTTGYRISSSGAKEASAVADWVSPKAAVTEKEARSMGAKAGMPLERVQRIEGRPQASSESILDEYDGASRMLEQMISDQLEESVSRRPIASAASKLQQQQKQRPQNQRTDSLSQSIHSADTGSRDSPKSVIANYNYPTAKSRAIHQQQQRLNTGGSSRSSSVAQQEGSTAGAGSSRKVSTCSSSAAAAGGDADAISVVTAASVTPASARRFGSLQEPMESRSGEPLEKRSIWRPSGRLVTARRARETSESSDGRRKSIESNSLGKFAEKQKPPPPPPKVDYDVDDSVVQDKLSDMDGVVHVVAAELPPAESSDEEGSTRRESQMDRMKRRTLSSYRSMRNKISDFMSGEQVGQQGTRNRNRAANKSLDTNVGSHTMQQPTPPKRSSSIGSRSELPTTLAPDTKAQQVAGSPRGGGQRESRSLKRRPPTEKGPSFGQQIRERLSRSKSRLTKFLGMPDKARRRAQSQPGGSGTADRIEGSPASTRREILFQPGDLARNWNSGETRQPNKPSGDEEERKALGISSPVPATTGSSNSSLNGLDLGTTDARSGRSSQRQRKPTAKTSSRPTSLISLKRLSASFRPNNKTDHSVSNKNDEDDELELGPSESGNGKPGRRARRRRRRAAAATQGNQSAGSGAQESGSPQVAARVPTTNDYFGQVAPPRVDSPLERSPTVRRTPLGGGPKRAESQPASPEPHRPNRSQSLRSVRLMLPAAHSEDEDEDEAASDQRPGGDRLTEGQKRTVSFSNLNRRLLPSTNNTFRPASACAELALASEKAAQQQQQQQSRTDGAESPQAPEVGSLPVTPVGPSNSAFSTNGGLEPRFKPIPPPFGQHQLQPVPAGPRSKSAAMLDDFRHKCNSLFGQSPLVRRKRAGTPAAPARPPRSRSGGAARVRSKSALAANPPTESPDIIEVQPSTPGSSLERNAARHPTSGNGPKNKLASLAQQFKHSASDFFQASDSTRQRTQTLAAGRKSPASGCKTTQQVEPSLCEWKPVIAVRDAKMANRSAGSSIVAGVLNMGKDGCVDGGDDGDEQQKEREEEAPRGSGPAAENRTGGERVRLQQQQQQSLDTDSTWESTDDEDEDYARSDDRQPVKPLRRTIVCGAIVQARDDSSTKGRVFGETEPTADEPMVCGVGESLTGYGSGVSGPALNGDGDGAGGDKAMAVQGRVAAAAAASSKGFTCYEEPNNNNINNNRSLTSYPEAAAGAAAARSNHQQQEQEQRQQSVEPKQAKRAEAAQGQQLRSSQQQVAVSSQHLDGNSKNSTPTTTNDNDATAAAAASRGEDKQRKESTPKAEQVDVESSTRLRGNSREFDRAAHPADEQRICKTPFRFNADLPTPSQLLLKQRPSQHEQLNRPLAGASSEPLDATRTSSGEESKKANSSKSKIPTPVRVSQTATNTMTATLSSGRPIAGSTAPTGAPRLIDETDARLLEALGHKRAPPRREESTQESRSKQEDKSTEQDLSVEEEDESQKRLSVYENMPTRGSEQQQQQLQSPAATSDTTAPVKQKRGWRKPPWPPEKPAHLRKVAAGGPESTPPGSPSAWSVGDDAALPKVPAEKLQEFNRALDEPRTSEGADGSGFEADKPPVKPKRRLITMTSIIQEPGDELMVADAASGSSTESCNPQAGGQHKSFVRQDSAFSVASLATDNNSEDSDSSFAAAAASRRRLVSKFESPKPPATAPRPKFPAFEDGKSALARGSPDNTRGQSLVKRLARTFDQTAQEQQTTTTGKPPTGLAARGGPSARCGGPTSLAALRNSFELDEPKSESSWYDAKQSSEQLDEAEVAKFLAEFDNDQRNSEAAGISEDVSTGADPFVTVAESTLEEPPQVEDNDEPGDDDTLNDEVDDDLEDDANLGEGAFGEERGTPTEEPQQEQQQQRRRQRQGKDAELVASSAADTCCAAPTPFGANESELSGGEERPTAATVAVTAQMAAPNNNNNSDNNNSNRSSSTNESGTSAADKPPQAASSPLSAANSTTPTPAPPGASNTNTPNSGVTLPAAALAVADARDCADNDNDNHRDEPISTAANANPAIARERTDPPTTTTTTTAPTSGAHLIDNKFKTSLNHIIARRSSRGMGPLEDRRTSCDGAADTKLTAVAAAVDGTTHSDKAKHSCCSKELKGLTRYYHALLGRRPRSSKKAKKDKLKADGTELSENNNNDDKENESLASEVAPQIDDCIHSSSSSSSSSTCTSPSYSRSCSPVSSRSPSIEGSSCSSAAQTDDESAGGEALRHMDNQKLVRDAKKCSRLYEELEKILAHRMARQQKVARRWRQHRRPQSGTSAEIREVEAGADTRIEDLKEASPVGGEQERQPQQRRSADGESGDFCDFYSWSLVSCSSSMGPPDDQISLSSSSVSSESIPELKQRQNLQKLYHVVNEIHSSEAKFVDTLRLLNQDFRQHMQPLAAGAGGGGGGSSAASECLANILKHLPQLQALNENLLEELRLARDQWPKTRKIAHVLVKIGPFLKHYSTYIREFDALQQQLMETMKKSAQFAERVREFEASDRCQKLTIQHHLLRPIQRIPQYRLLLQQYLHHLKPDDVDYEDTVSALEVVSRVAEHANQSMSEGANFAKLLALQAKIVGKRGDIVQPGRLFVREGELLKVCRKQVQPRWFVLLNDALLYLTQIQSSDILYLNNELPLDDCQVSTPSESKQSANLIGQQFETEFSVCSKARSFALIAKSRAERDEWVATLRRTIDEHLARRRSFSIRQQQNQYSLSPPPFTDPADPQRQAQANYQTLPMTASQLRQQQGRHLLGQKAPLWTPDSRVSMCQLCTSSFSALFRRHHCRCCGRVVCSACSGNRAPLVYLKCRSARVCDQCFEQLRSNIPLYYLGSEQVALGSLQASEQAARLGEQFRTLLKSQFVRHAGMKSLRLGGTARSASGLLAPSDSAAAAGGATGAVQRGSVLANERLGANDSGSTISGYLHRRHPNKPKWKRQWFVIRERVLYAYRAIDDVAAVSSTPLLGFSVDQPAQKIDGLEPKSLIRLRHLSDYARPVPGIGGPQANQPKSNHQPLKRKSSKGKVDEQPVIEHLFKAESVGAAERWLEAFRTSVVLAPPIHKQVEQKG